MAPTSANRFLLGQGKETRRQEEKISSHVKTESRQDPEVEELRESVFNPTDESKEDDE